MPEMPAEINTSEPHPARIYDYFIGGKNNFAADRKTAAEVLRRSPAAHIAARPASVSPHHHPMVLITAAGP